MVGEWFIAEGLVPTFRAIYFDFLFIHGGCSFQEHYSCFTDPIL